MSSNYEHEYTTIQGVEFVGNFSISKEEFIKNPKGLKVIETMLDKVSTQDIFSNGQKVGDYLDYKIKEIISKLCNISNNAKELETNLHLYDHEIKTTYYTNNDGHKIISGLEDHSDILGYNTPYIILNLIDNGKNNTQSSSYTNTKLASQLENSKIFENISNFILQYDYKIETVTNSFPIISYIIALISLGDQVIISINNQGMIEFCSYDYFIQRLNYGIIAHGLDNALDFLLIDELRDDIELISKIYDVNIVEKETLKLEKLQKDIQECVFNVSNGKLTADIQNGQIREIEYQFKSSDSSIDNFKRLSRFVEGQGSIGYEYHRGIKKNIIGSKKYNYKRQARYIQIANENK